MKIILLCDFGKWNWNPRWANWERSGVGAGLQQIKRKEKKNCFLLKKMKTNSMLGKNKYVGLGVCLKLSCKIENVACVVKRPRPILFRKKKPKENLLKKKFKTLSIINIIFYFF